VKTSLLPDTSERLIPQRVRSRDEHLLVLRHVFAYEFAKRTLSGCGPVLDLGCGEGYGTSLLSRAVGEIVGLDVDAAAIAHAASQYASANCRFRRHDGERLPFVDAAFDAVVSFQVIEHVPGDRMYVSEVSRVLAPGGQLVLTTPNAANRLGPGGKPWNRFHVREYRAAELGDLLAGGFDSVEVLGITACPEIHEIEMARVRQSRRIVALDPLGLARVIPSGMRPVVTRIARRVMRRERGKESVGDWAARYGLADYNVTRDDTDDCLDLLAVCRK
jgi:SAM-dependent methyltransferase